MSTTAFATSPTSDLIRHIVTVHHEYLRAEIPRVSRLNAAVRDADGPGAERHAALASRWNALAHELLEHQEMEEREVFPAIEDAPECVSGLGPAAIVARAAYVDKLVHDHRSILAGLDEVRRLANGYVPPAGATDAIRELYRTLERVDEDTRAHLRKETDELFARLVSCLN